MHNLQKQLQTLDFRTNGNIDLESVHPKTLYTLLQENLVQDIDPGDGENCFYILTEQGLRILQENDQKQV